MEKAKMELKEKNNYTEESVFLNKLNFDGIDTIKKLKSNN